MIKLEILTTSLGCAKCKRAMKIITSVTSKFKGKIKILETDITKHPETLSKYNIMNTPSIVIEGKLIFEGIPSVGDLENAIKEAL